jgi:hypothetical protein
LLPLRKVGDRDWPNWDPFTRWESREKYLEAMHRIRIPLIANLWRQHKPRYTICYGRGYWSWFREVFDLPFRPIGSLPARAAFSGDSAVVLTHFFAPRAGVGEAFIDELARELEGFTR